MSDPIADLDSARSQRDRARHALAQIRGVIVALSKGVGTPDTAVVAIARILHVGAANRRIDVRPARRERRAASRTP